MLRSDVHWREDSRASIPIETRIRTRNVVRDENTSGARVSELKRECGVGTIHTMGLVCWGQNSRETTGSWHVIILYSES